MTNGRLAQSRIGVLGTGEVGQRLAAGFRSRGHEVMIGSRDPAKPELREWLSGEGAGIESGTFAQVAGHGELLVLALLGERVQRALPDARVVKAFNTIGSPYFVDPGFSEGRPTMLIAGDDAQAKRTVGDVLADFGWSDVVDIGGLRGSWDHGFGLLAG